VQGIAKTHLEDKIMGKVMTGEITITIAIRRSTRVIHQAPFWEKI
jgi:hypothetical protein